MYMYIYIYLPVILSPSVRIRHYTRSLRRAFHARSDSRFVSLSSFSVPSPHPLVALSALALNNLYIHSRYTHYYEYRVRTYYLACVIPAYEGGNRSREKETEMEREKRRNGTHRGERAERTEKDERDAARERGRDKESGSFERNGDRGSDEEQGEEKEVENDKSEREGWASGR